MDDLIRALQILRKYGNPRWPMDCRLSSMYINPIIRPSDVSHEDLEELRALSFHVTTDEGKDVFYSLRFGHM